MCTKNTQLVGVENVKMGKRQDDVNAEMAQ